MLAATNPEVNLVGDPVQPNSWELRKKSDMPNVSEDDSESDEANEGDSPISLFETRKELEEKMSLKVNDCSIRTAPPRIEIDAGQGISCKCDG